MYQISICDDDEVFCKDLHTQISFILKGLAIDYHLSVFHEPEHLLAEVQNKTDKFHLTILDILLKNKNGIDIGRTLRTLGVKDSILFLTSTKDYSYEGYDVNPIHYLLKPINKEKLTEVLKKDYFDRFQPKHIFLPYHGGQMVLEINTIWYIETLNRQIIIHTQTEEIRTTDTLQNILKLLPESSFIRCHKSFIINISKLKTFTKAEFILNDNTIIPAGRAFYNNVISNFISYLENS